MGIDCSNHYKPKNKYSASQAVQKFMKVKTAGRKCTNFTRSVLTAQELSVTAKIAICRSCNVLHSLNTKYHSLCQYFNVLYLLNTMYCSPCHSFNMLHLLNTRYCLLMSLLMCYMYWTHILFAVPVL
jgi:hypothetical protein